MTNATHPSLFSRLKSSLTGGMRRPRIESLSLHAFGKLPIYKDFISCGLTDDPSRELRDWLSEGYSRRWSVVEGYREVVIPPFSFLFLLPHSGKFVTGTLWGSGDQGGLRRFPFLLFSVLSGGRAAAPLPVLECLQAFEQKGADIRSAFGEGGTLADFYHLYRGAKVELPLLMTEDVEEGVRTRLSELSVGEFAESLLGASAKSRWAPFVASFLEKAQADGAAAVRFPLGDLLPPSLQVQFWIQWLRETAPKSDVPTGFLYQNGGGGRAVLLLRSLRAEDIFLLHPSSRDYDHVEETPDQPEPSSAADEPADSPAGFSNPLGTLLSGQPERRL